MCFKTKPATIEIPSFCVHKNAPKVERIPKVDKARRFFHQLFPFTQNDPEANAILNFLHLVQKKMKTFKYLRV